LTRALYLITIRVVIIGGGLLAAGIILMPVLGFASGTVGAVGIWGSLLGALCGCLLLVTILFNRLLSGRWYYGTQPPPKE
jgi:hypothetical protein